ncbi:hypothetical protein [Polaribacter sp. AHE13PA]|uniref:DUF6892 domain-containing protein n=1 Tax=Polaribacter sp. AHE13PA TaxID=2745562 RepID=UPI001C4EBAB4|nr:hypothetical protein [Polaribacter sp. AHE13PA]QXP67646.1 hypothetical protein H0I28_03845 [Polaribacter sp. AHE13PA]
MTTIHLSLTGFLINSVSIQFPISINTLKECLNDNYRTTKRKSNTIFTWDDLGLLAYSKNGECIESLTLELQLDTYSFCPKHKFSGAFYFNDQEITNYYKTNKEERVQLFKDDDSGALVLNTICAWFSVNEEETIKAIEVSAYQPYVRWQGIPDDKYTIKPIDEEEITFVDFGFKLSIIEELMYMKGLLEPKFDIYEFADWYRERKIDIDDEGYEPIAEVVQYFKDLPIPKRLATEITDIYQDGGNDIYMNLSPFSGGGEDDWDMETAVDDKQFPNLKKATLCYAKDCVYDEFEKMGIDAESL